MMKLNEYDDDYQSNLPNKINNFTRRTKPKNNEKIQEKEIVKKVFIWVEK